MTLTTAAPELIGGRYALGNEIVTIRASVIREAVDHKTGQPVMIICDHLGPHQANVVAARQQTRVLAQRLASLRHRNLPRVVDLVEDGESLYTVLEELKGRPMHELPLPLHPELVRRYCEQMLTVLDYLHNQDPAIVHRDVRPDSVLVSPHGTLYLLGTGLARVVASTVAKTVFRGEGSPDYAAPEQLMGEASSPANDLYSIGAVCYFLATGKPPHASLKRLREIDQTEPLPDTLHKGLSHLIMKLLEIEVEDRPATAAEALALLRSEDEGPRELAPAFMAPEPEPEPEPAPAVPAADGSVPAEAPAAPKPAADTGATKKSMWSVLFGGKKEEKKPEEAGKKSGKIKLQIERSVPQSTPDEHSELAVAAREAHETVDLSEMELDLTVAQMLPETAARSIQGICIGLPSPNEMMVAVKDPSLVYIYDHVDFATQSRYRAVVRGADPAWVDRALEWVYKNRSKTNWRTFCERRALDAVQMIIQNPMADIATLGEEISHPVIEATERIVKEALAVNTSDIHMEAFEKRLEVRYRIDGVLQHAVSYDPSMGTSMIKRIKVMANMDIAQERITQGGRISLSLGDQKYDLRVSIVPVAHGESVVMRVLKKGSFNLTLKDLGLDAEVERRFREALSQPHGIILVCGPTGSGKSTTLYASLKELMRPDRKLLTVEDPIEYEMDGLVQVQVNMAPKDEEQRVTFAKVLREFLRQDPEVILVGEIRDQETAAIALQAALTGHLVLSTVHTNDSIGIVSRLRDMGCKSFLVASTLRAGLAQRLARRICGNCKEEIPMTPEVKDELVAQQIPEPHKQFKGKGCKECRNSGYRGRIGIYEVLQVSPELRTLMSKEALDVEMLECLQKDGFKTLYQNGLSKVVSGAISFEEVQRVCESGGH